MFGIKQTDSKSSTWMMFNTDRNKPLCNEKRIGRYGYSYRGTSGIRTTSNCRKMNTKCNYTHVNNINMTMTEFFFGMT